MLGVVLCAWMRRRADAVRAASDLALCSLASICWNSLAAEFLVWRRRLPGLPVSSVYVLSVGVLAGTLGSVAGGGDAGMGGTLGTGTGVCAGGCSGIEGKETCFAGGGLVGDKGGLLAIVWKRSASRVRASC